MSILPFIQLKVQILVFEAIPKKEKKKFKLSGKISSYQEKFLNNLNKVKGWYVQSAVDPINCKSLEVCTVLKVLIPTAYPVLASIKFNPLILFNPLLSIPEHLPLEVMKLKFPAFAMSLVTEPVGVK